MTEDAAAVAAIDCGTNSTRLLVADAARPRPSNAAPRSRGSDKASTARTALRRKPSNASSPPSPTTAASSTSTASTTPTRSSGSSPPLPRGDASNREELFERIAATLGRAPELLSGDDEGRLSFAGATQELDPGNGPFLVVDIGGGSTELVVGTAEPTGVTSIDVGCVRLTERYLGADPPDPGELSDALSVVRVHLDDVVRDVPQTLDAARLVGLAGSVTTVAAVELGLRTYDRSRIHHFVLTRRAAEDVFRTLATESRVDRAANPGLEPERVDVVVAGALVLVAVMRYFDFDECLVSESDILDGLVATLLPTT